MYIDKFIKRIFPMDRQVVSTHSQDEATLASNKTPPPIETSVTKDAERVAMGYVNEPLKAQSDVYANHTICVEGGAQKLREMKIEV